MKKRDIFLYPLLNFGFLAMLMLVVDACFLILTSGEQYFFVGAFSTWALNIIGVSLYKYFRKRELKKFV
jgi:hypothetical protein